MPQLAAGCPTSHDVWRSADLRAHSRRASILLSRILSTLQPSVITVTPSIGTQGTQIVLTGENLGYAVSVTVGGAQCLSINIISANSISCLVPQGPAAGGPVDVAVTADHGLVGTLPGGFVYRSVIVTPSAVRQRVRCR